jgi:hypothetical protein
MRVITQDKLLHGLSLIILFLVAAFPALYHGIFRDALANADMDIVAVYQALLIIAGEPLVPNSHPGFAYFISLAGWLKVFDWLNLISVVDIESLKVSTNFNENFAQIIVAGRLFSIFLACIFTSLVYTSVWSFHPHRVQALLLCLALIIGGGGLPAQSVMMRTELPSMILVLSTGLAILRATRVNYTQSMGLLLLAGLFAHVAMMIKVQSIIVLIFFPLLAIIFGYQYRERVIPSPSNFLLSAVLVVALIISFPVIKFLVSTILPESYGIYQLFIFISVFVCALIYGFYNLHDVRHGIIGFSIVSIGFSLAFGGFFFFEDWWTIFSVFNFIEIMSVHLPLKGTMEYLDSSQVLAKALIQPQQDIFSKLANLKLRVGLGDFFAERLKYLDYPFAIFYIVVPACIPILILKNKFNEARIVSFLCLMTGMIVVIFWMGRGFFNFYYSIYVEVWMIIALAIVGKGLFPLTLTWKKNFYRLGQAIGLIVMVAIIGTNIRYRVLDVKAANPVVAKSACFIRGLTPLLYNKFDDYCGTG